MIISKAQSLCMAVAAGVFLAALPAHAVTISSFNPDPIDVNFDPGGVFDFDIDDLFDDFTVSGQTGGGGALIGLGGELDGSFTFDTLGNVTTTAGGFRIDDGDGDSAGTDDILTGVLDFDTIEFFEGGVSQTVTLSGTLAFDPGYVGLNADLASLASEATPYLISTDFIYLGLTTFQSLFDDGDGGESPVIAFGTVSVPEPGTLATIGFGLIGIGLAFRRRNQKHGSQDMGIS